MAHELSIRLVRQGASVEKCPDRDYDDELDDVGAVIEDACAAIAESKAARFCVSGFAAAPWPVDVETDLAVLLEQLPDVVTGLREGRDFEINFHEQGLERTLYCRPQGDLVEIECASRHATWTPDEPISRIKRDEFEGMLRSLALEFVTLLDQACPALAKHEWMREWKESIGV